MLVNKGARTEGRRFCDASADSHATGILALVTLLLQIGKKASTNFMGAKLLQHPWAWPKTGGGNSLAEFRGPS